MNEAGLDCAFLDYIGHNSELQKSHQQFYVPFFAHCRQVVDLGCGYGDFVELLRDHHIHAVGVDVDPIASRVMGERSLAVVNQDATTFLRALPPESIDGVFASHLVEHLPYESTYEIAKLSYRALQPGGVIVLTTPDPRSLFAHLEMFYLHFGHVTFYHPRLLCFFLEQAGFPDPIFGSVESSVHPSSPLFGSLDIHPIRAKLPVWKTSLVRRLLRRVRMAMAYLFLNPYLDLVDSNFRQLYGALQGIDRPFECYVKAVKPFP